jgi:type I restriction-modification system DNA methylase subunit
MAKRKNSPLAYLRQTISNLPQDNNSSLVLFLSALTLLCRNGRLKHLTKTQLNSFSPKDLRQLVQLLSDQLITFTGSREKQSLEANDDVFKTIWHSLQNKHLDSLWSHETTLGYVYQFLCLPRRSQSLSKLSQSNKTIDAETLIAFTQLYTPDWVSEFLLQNTIMPQWHEKIPIEKLTVLDPACGAGNFLLQAFNLLTSLYLQSGATEKEACQSILKHNLYGTDIDRQALFVTGLALMARSLKANTIDDLKMEHLQAATSTYPTLNILGSLNRQWAKEDLLGQKYQVVVTNPPYIGRKLLDRSLKHALKTNYPNSHNDLANAFLERCIELTEPSGMVGVITQSSIISLPSYKNLRKSLITTTSIDTCVELGPGVFPLQGGEKINSLLLVLKNETFRPESKQLVRFIDLTSTNDKSTELTQADVTQNVYQISQNTLRQNDNFVFNYRCPNLVSKLMKEALPLADTAEIRQGLATTDNERFLRFWWDVDADLIGKRWFPYAKGAGIRRWHNPIKHMVNWQNSGEEIKEAVTLAYPYLKGKSAWVVKNEKYYFRKGLTFSFIGGQDLAVRYLPAGCIFDVAGSAIFVEEDSIFWHLAYLNSSLIRAIALNLNPSINFQVGDLKKLPVINFLGSEKIELNSLAEKCFDIKEWINNFDPTVYANELPEELKGILNGQSIEANWRKYVSKHEDLSAKLHQLEEAINQIVLNAAARQWRLDESDLSTLTNWVQKFSPTSNGNESMDTKSFVKIAMHHLINKHLSKNTVLSFSLDDTNILQLPEQENAWLSKELNQPLNTYLISQLKYDQVKQFSGSPQLFCEQVKGNGHAIVFSTHTLRNFERRNLDTQNTSDGSMLEALLGQVSQTKDWTGRHLLSFL